MPRDENTLRHRGIRGPVIAGLFVMVAFVVLFGGWTAFAPLESAAIAPGIVSVEANRKTVQHLEGGIVERLLVRDGDVVLQGQVLVSLEGTRARASYELLRGRWIAAMAQEARLLAERDGAAAIVFSERVLAARARPDVAEAIEGEVRIFEGRRSGLARQIAVLGQRARQSHEEIIGLRGQITAEDRQLALVREEKADIQTLVNQGLAPRPRLLALQRREAEIAGSRSRNVAAIARAEQAITESELRVAELRTQTLNEASEELRQVQNRIYELTQELRASEDALKRVDVVSPIDGIVVRLQVHTPGGVIAPGAPLMDIVPTRERRIIEARINPIDIDVVRPGLEARVRLTALPHRSFVPIVGEVMSVSADRLSDDKTGEPYFLALVALKENDPRLYPGMQAEVMIVTGRQTLFEYLAQPLLQAFDRALRET